MASLAGATITSTFPTLIKLDANDATLVAAASGAAIRLKTGDNDDTPVYLNTDRVGIGTATPYATLDVAGLNGSSNIYLTLMDDSISDTNEIGNIAWRTVDADGTTDSDICAMIKVQAAQVHDGADFGTDMLFYTASNNSSSLDERMRILDDGFVGIGTTVPVNPLFVLGNIAADYVAVFHNDGNLANRHGIAVLAGQDDGTAADTVYFTGDDGNGDSIGTITHASSDGNFKINATSDARLKTDIADTKINGLNIINAVKVREFTKIKAKVFNKAGFIAQELKEVWPQAVSGDPNGDVNKAPMSVSDTSLIAPIIKAVQELSAKVAALEAV